MITENGDNNGFHPMQNDRQRTHLMAAILLASVGIPLLAEGQDFLRSKHGVNNTYLRGDLNALDYRRLYRHLGTHAYFADWIAFRRSETGRLLRQHSRPSEGFFAFHLLPGSPALAVVYNADFSQGPVRLLFAVNPTLGDVIIPVGPGLAERARALAHGGAGRHHVVDHDHVEVEVTKADDYILPAKDSYETIAAGRAHIVADPIMNPWDLVPVLPVLRGAGATVTSWDGGDPVKAGNIIAAAPKLHAETMRSLAD